jgi:hypothetical protein
MMEALIIQTGTPPGPDGIALWVTMKISIHLNVFKNFKIVSPSTFVNKSNIE